jgi:hypothetical protein
VAGAERKLEYVAIDHNMVTDAGLIPLSKMTTLRWIDVRGSRITEAGKK